MNSKVFVSTGGIRNLNAFEACESLSKFGLNSFELSGGKYFQNNLNTLINLEKKGFQIQIHNYFPVPKTHFVLNLASSDELIFNLSFEHCKKAIILASKLKLKRYSVHAGFCIDPTTKELGKPFNKKKLINDRSFFLERFINRVKILNNFAKLHDVDLYIENNVSIKENIFNNKALLLGSDYEEIKAIKDSTNTKILIDTGHLVVSAKSLGLDEKVELSKLKFIADAYHLSSNNRLRDQNKPIKDDVEIINLISKEADFYTIEVYAKGALIKEDYNFIENWLKN